MGLCLSICVRNDDYEEFHNSLAQDRRHLLSDEEYEDEEVVAARRKDELDKIVNETISGFVDISLFLDIKRSIPANDIIKNAQKEKFNFGNGMDNHYKLLDEEIDQLYINLTSDSISPMMKDNLKKCSREINQTLSAGLEKISAVSTNIKVVGKL